MANDEFLKLVNVNSCGYIIGPSGSAYQSQRLLHLDADGNPLFMEQDITIDDLVPLPKYWECGHCGVNNHKDALACTACGAPYSRRVK